ncbi:hypothetical protein [uncultured Formosa sp.]|uniref:hypothetical protein n=1 Tax=uncultured Formosa sp. TaxID=255435 RepID=UPI0026117130|nr:hypothetical protein [uncultured Formosa sp.]
MASNNIETNIKNSLEKRRLQPSAQAWNQLQSQLDAQESTHSFKPYWFMAIAASFIGVLLLSTWMFKSNTNTDLQVVDVEIPVEKTEVVIDSSTSSLEEVIVSLPKDEVVKTSKENGTLKAVSLNKNRKKTHTIVETLNPKEETKALGKLNSTLEDTLSNSALAQQEQAVSNDYIEDLLQQAEQQISSEKALKVSQQTVDSKALLESVENDIEHSFRDKVFEAVKSGFVKVKTAVVERND